MLTHTGTCTHRHRLTGVCACLLHALFFIYIVCVCVCGSDSCESVCRRDAEASRSTGLQRCMRTPLDSPQQVQRVNKVHALEVRARASHLRKVPIRAVRLASLLTCVCVCCGSAWGCSKEENPCLCFFTHTRTHARTHTHPLSLFVFRRRMARLLPFSTCCCFCFTHSLLLSLSLSLARIFPCRYLERMKNASDRAAEKAKAHHE